MKVNKILISAIVSLLVSCTTEQEKYAAISGEWNAAAWLVRGQPSDKNLSNVYFRFNQNKTYQSQLGAQKESGTFRIKGDYLYTQAPDRLEIMVKISKLTSDTLVLDMNNAGQEETLILVRKK